MRARHEPVTRGGRLLRDWLQRERRSQEWLATELRREGEQLHQTTVSTWIGGKVPSTVFALRIEELTGIPIRAWLEAAVDADESGSHAAVATDRTG